MKRIIGIIVAGICLAMMLITWRNPGFAGWAVAFAGWVQLVFGQDHEDNNGQS